LVVSMLATGALLPAAAVLSALLLAVWFTLGAAAGFDVRLNFLNFVALPLTFGIGVEYSINLYDRVRALGDIKQSLQSVGGAIAACSLTTMLGYGTLLFGDNLALRSFGKYAVIGELSCLFTALLVLPAGLTLFRRRPRVTNGAVS
jgi:predicted RND superfamily exporter protein